MTSHPPPQLPPGFERLLDRPLRDPLLILAFSGWSDGGDAASTAIRYLCEQLDALPFARMDCEDYYDFTVVRPQVRTSSEGHREIDWPDQPFWVCRPAALDVCDDSALPDIVISTGEEPHLRWRTFTRKITAFAQAIGAQRVISLGAYLADVIYSQPTRVSMTASDPEWTAAYELRTPRYEGATGILTVLCEALREASVPSAMLWAPIPHYVVARPNPRGALALLERLEIVTGRSLELERLREMVGEFDDEVSQTIASDPELSAYVRELKRRAFSR